MKISNLFNTFLFSQIFLKFDRCIHEPIENFIVVEIGVHFQANMHIAAHEIQIIKRCTNFNEGKTWHSNTNWWWIPSSDSIFV